MKDYGKRHDPKQGKKGRGWYGEIPVPGTKDVATEKSVSFDDGVDVPSIVPGLTRKEIDDALNDRPLSREHVRKIMEHRRKREAEGKSPYAGDEDPLLPMPDDDKDFQEGFKKVRGK